VFAWARHTQTFEIMKHVYGGDLCTSSFSASRMAANKLMREGR
jgi:hypothetical protein